MIQIKTWTVGPFAENPYLIACTSTAQAILVDPGDKGPELWQAVVDQGVSLVAIVLTHAHLDHVGAVEYVRGRAGVPVYLHAADAPLLAAVAQQARLFGLEAAPVAPAERTLADGDTLDVGRIRFGVLHTPGHSPGSVCLYAEQEKLLIAGDTLFRRGFGRTDLPGGDADALVRSIETQLWPLPDDVRVLPGHGSQTTIGEERRLNPIAELSFSGKERP